MSVPLDPSLFVIPCCLFVVFAGMAVQTLIHKLREPGGRAVSEYPEDWCRCVYCGFDRAEMWDESMTVDGEMLIEVRGYACPHCGLPQWVVTRTPVVQSTR